ncbi:MAG: BON domain-containing protein [Pyrinomonadaceae bacterium]|nr:BON domain-containing protein [Pyrinomonadaceae bacterium]
MKKIILFMTVAAMSVFFAACETTKETNSNNAIVTNANNANVTNTNVNKEPEDKELTREDFDKDKGKYEKEAKDAGSTIGSNANDLWLWTKVRSVLMVGDVRESTINVDVENEVVTLRGTVASSAEKDAAVKAARGVEGVKDVKDMLKVAPKDSVTNMADDGKSDADKSNTNKK